MSSGATLENLYTAYYRQNGITPPTDCQGNILLMSAPIYNSGSNTSLQVGSAKVYMTSEGNPINSTYGGNFPVGILRFALSTQYGNTPNGLSFDNDNLLADQDLQFANVSDPLPSGYYSPNGNYGGQYPSLYSSGKNGGFFANGPAQSDTPANIYSGGVTMYPLMLDIPFSFENGNTIPELYQQSNILASYTNGSNYSSFNVTIPNVPFAYDFGSSSTDYTQINTKSVLIDPTLDPNYNSSSPPWSQNLSMQYCELVISMVYNSSYSLNDDSNLSLQGQLTVNFVINFPSQFYISQGVLDTIGNITGTSNYLQPVILTCNLSASTNINVLVAGAYGNNEPDYVSTLEAQYTTNSVCPNDPEGQGSSMVAYSYSNFPTKQPSVNGGALTPAQITGISIGSIVGASIVGPASVAAADALFNTIVVLPQATQVFSNLGMYIYEPNFANGVRFFGKAFVRSFMKIFSGIWKWVVENPFGQIFSATSDAAIISEDGAISGAMAGAIDGSLATADVSGTVAAEAAVDALEILADL